MTFGEWIVQIKSELEAAGYRVDMYAGFPIVKHPPIEQKLGLIRWVSPSGLPCCKSIYAEGMLFSPQPIPPQ